MIYIGLDVHKVNAKVAWLDGEAGEISDRYDCPTAQLAEQLAALAEPQRGALAQRRYTGPLTERGNRFLRWAMVLAAQHFGQLKATKKLLLRKWYRHLGWKHGRNAARVALARRLLDIIFAMLRDGVEFDQARLAVTGPDR